MKMNKLLIGVTSVITLTLASTLPVQAADPIVIGVASGQTGVLSPWDVGGRQGAEIAVEDINAKGGVLGRPLKLVISDTKSDPSLGPTAAAEVISEGAEMVIVACDYDFGSPAALTAVARGKIAFSTCAADPKFGVQGVGPKAYTMSLATNGQGAVLAEWGFREKGWKTAYIMTDTAIEYTKSLCSHFKHRWQELAGKDSIVGEDTWNGLNDTSIAGQVSRLKNMADKVDVVMWCGFTKNGSALRQVRSAGIDTAILGSESMDGVHWLDAVPDLKDYYIAVYASIHGNDPDPGVQKFMARFKEKYGKGAPMGHVITGYSVVEAWAKAVERAGSVDGDAVKAELDEFANEKLLIGPTTYEQDLHINLKRPMLIMERKDGRYYSIGRVAAEKVVRPAF
jgi:branched-chain amino acid transport system substrate-binding protein